MASRAGLLARALGYALLILVGAIALGFVVLPAVGLAAGLFTIEAEARGAFSLVTLKAAPFLPGLCVAAAIPYEWIASLSMVRRVVVYCATTLLVWAAGAAIAAFLLG